MDRNLGIMELNGLVIFITDTCLFSRRTSNSYLYKELHEFEQLRSTALNDSILIVLVLQLSPQIFWFAGLSSSANVDSIRKSKNYSDAEYLISVPLLRSIFTHLFSTSEVVTLACSFLLSSHENRSLSSVSK